MGKSFFVMRNCMNERESVCVCVAFFEGENEWT